MSIISSLVICILCLSSLPSSSTARHFGVVNKLLQNTTLFQDPPKLHSTQKEEMEKNSSKSSPKIENNDTIVVRVDECKKMIKTQGDRKTKANQQVVGINGQGRRSQGHIINDEDQAIKRSNGVTKSKFSKSVNSWRVPRNKKRKEVPQTGFNLDYAPPKVHPPVHN